MYFKREEEKNKKNKFIKDFKEIEITNEIYVLNEFVEDSYLGEIEVFNKKKRQYYAIANRETHLMVLSKSDMESIIKEEFPQVYQDLRETADKRLEVDMDKQREIESILMKMNYENTLRRDQSNYSDTSTLLQEEVNTYGTITLDVLHERAKNSFPIEEMIGEQGTDVKDLELKDIVNNPDIQIELLSMQLEGRFGLIRLQRGAHDEHQHRKEHQEKV